MNMRGPWRKLIYGPLTAMEAQMIQGTWAQVADEKVYIRQGDRKSTPARNYAPFLKQNGGLFTTRRGLRYERFIKLQTSVVAWGHYTATVPYIACGSHNQDNYGGAGVGPKLTEGWICVVFKAMGKNEPVLKVLITPGTSRNKANGDWNKRSKLKMTTKSWLLS